MIFIDYPPGGLGNFLAQILTNQLDMFSQHMSFHRNPKKLYSVLTPESGEQFCQQIRSFVPAHEVSVIHSFGNLDQIRIRWPSATIVQIVVRQEIAILLNNMWRKAAADNPNSEETLSKRLIQYYNKDTVATRRENYALNYLYFKQTAGYHNTRHACTDIEINFDNLYQGIDLMFAELFKVKEDVDVEKIYPVFQLTQKPIIEKNKLYKDLVAGSVAWQKIKHNFDTIDHGLICGMLQEKYAREFFLPNQEHFELII